LREIAATVGMSNPGVLRVIRRGGDLEAVHLEPMAGDENKVFMTPNDHAKHDLGR
jgi:hypothetical protein